jgi:hypothetical protein
MGKAALIILMGFMLVVGGTLTNMVLRASDASENSIQFEEQVQARQIAKSAVDFLISLHLQTEVTDTTVNQENYLGGSFSSNIQLLGRNVSINQDTLQFTATGTVNNESYTSTVTLLSTLNTLLLPKVSGAITLYPEKKAFVDMKAQSLVDGTDTNPDGSEPAGPDLPGIASTLPDSTHVTREAKAEILGAEPSPAVADAYGEFQDILDYVETWKAIADYTYTGDQHFASFTHWGIPQAPAIVYINGDTKFSAWTGGFGILIIEGALDLMSTAQFYWEGLVVVIPKIGEGEVTGSVSYDYWAQSSLYGALIMGGENINLSIKAHSDIYYSQSILAKIGVYLESKQSTTTVHSTTERVISDLSWWE